MTPTPEQAMEMANRYVETKRFGDGSSMLKLVAPGCEPVVACDDKHLLDALAAIILEVTREPAERRAKIGEAIETVLAPFGHASASMGDPTPGWVMTHAGKVEALKATIREQAEENRRLRGALNECIGAMVVEMDDRQQFWVSRSPGGRFRDALAATTAALTSEEEERL